MAFTLEADFFPRLIAAYNDAPGKSTYGVLTTSIWPDYRPKNKQMNLDFESVRQFHSLIESGIRRGFFSSKLDQKEGIYRKITATEEQIQKIAGVLGQALKPTYTQAMTEVLKRYQNAQCPQLAAWVSRQLENFSGGSIPGWFRFSGTTVDDSREALELLLRGCAEAYSLTEDLPQREFSVRWFRGSKDFKDHYAAKLAAIMAPELAAGGVTTVEILKMLHMLQNPASVWIKGDVQLSFQNGDRLSCAPCPSGLALTQDYIKRLDRIETQSILTIENLTTFHQIAPPPATMVVFTSGYANELVVEFLRRAISCNGLSRIRHFGDLDAYGFAILENLSKRVGIGVSPYLMNQETYLAHRDQAVAMTDGNVRTFRRLLEDAFFSETEQGFFRFLLSEGKTLEQESISC